MSWKEQLNGDPETWLLEPGSPGVRFLALRDLAGRSPDDPELIEACVAAHTHGPIETILSYMQPEGYWVEPGPGYYPKYRSGVWALLMLAQLGARVDQEERVARACSYSLDNSLTSSGQFSVSGTPSGTADCLQGNMCWSLLALGCEDSRLDGAFVWMARTVTGVGLAPVGDRQAPLRYYAGNCGPRFACGSNNKLPCAWGAAKVMLAFSVLPPERHTPLIQQAIQEGLDFLFSVDPATAAYPCGFSVKPSRNWWKFGFPVFYVTDLLQIVEALVGLGYGNDPRLANALDLVRGKQDAEGRWPLEYDYHGKTWVDFGSKKQSNKWVTLRALRVLKAVS
jgi:hypothetical protein